MQIHVLTVFPQLYRAFKEYGMIARAIKKEQLELCCWSLRRFTEDSYGEVDDRPYGGGPGMVMKPEPYFRGVEHLQNYCSGAPVLLTDAGGKKFDQEAADYLSERQEMIILTGRYEGVDQRVKDNLVDECWSLGDFVTPDGDLPALTIISAVARLLPGVLGNESSVKEDSFQDNRLAPPVYTRPENYRGMAVPEVLLSGDHGAVERWRRTKARERTEENRPEL